MTTYPPKRSIHARHYPAAEPVFLCRYCDTKYDRRSSLSNHTKTHFKLNEVLNSELLILSYPYLPVSHQTPAGIIALSHVVFPEGYEFVQYLGDGYIQNDEITTGARLSKKCINVLLRKKGGIDDE